MRRKREPFVLMDKEEFKPIIGVAGYMVSNLGRIASFKKPQPILKKQFVNRAGYYRVGLYEGETYKHFYTHRLLAIAFIPNPENKPQVNHKNGIKTDNRLENIEWATPSENGIHSYANGLSIRTKGEISGQSVITNKIAMEICASDKKTQELVKVYNVSRETINRIRSGRSWSHVTGKIYLRKTA